MSSRRLKAIGRLAVDTNAVIAYREGIPENDIWIAAICLELDVPLLSSDGHFEHINGLEVINWQKSNCES